MMLEKYRRLVSHHASLVQSEGSAFGNGWRSCTTNVIST
jgi:hypothetical protein